jgi:ribosome modulation factor
MTEMSKKPKVSPSLKRMLAYAEGHQAFEEKRWHAFNPYKGMHEKLASDWLSGWDQAKEESDIKARHVTVNGYH